MNATNAPKLVLQLDLLPHQSRCEALGKLRCGALLVSMMATAIVLLGIRYAVLGVADLVGDYSPQIERVENELVQLQGELERRRSAVTALRDKRKAATESSSQKHAIAKMLSTLSSLTPVSVSIRSIALTPFEMEIAGAARDVEAVRQWMKDIVAACGGYTPTLQELRMVQFGRVRAHEFVARIVRPQSLERLEPCVSGENPGGL